jgi:ATP-dependent DNA helicase 2 subunit 2
MNAQSILYYTLQQDSFYFNVLPFAEDVREFQFRSFSSLPSSSQPTEEQQEAADNLVKMLDLAPPGREVLKPEFTPNPMLEVLFFMVEHHVECIHGPICYSIFIYSLH